MYRIQQFYLKLKDKPFWFTNVEEHKEQDSSLLLENIEVTFICNVWQINQKSVSLGLKFKGKCFTQWKTKTSTGSNGLLSYSSISVTFCNCCSNTFSTTRVSNRAKGAPTQKWIPELNARCALVSRLISNLSGSLKTVSSRLAYPKQTIIFCPEEIILPSMFTLSLTANLNIDWILPWPC